MFAACGDNADVSNLLIRYGADMTAQDNSGNTSFHLAAGCNNSLMVRFYLEKGMDVSFTGKQGQTPLMSTTYLLAEEAAEVLINHGADVNRSNNAGKTALHLVIPSMKDDVKIRFVKLLIDVGADLDKQDNAGNTPLHIALLRPDKANRKVARMLIDAGADLNIKNKKGQTPASIMIKTPFEWMITITIGLFAMWIDPLPL